MHLKGYKVTRNHILKLFHILNDKLKDNNIRGDILIYGGAMMSLCFNSRESSGDIDGLFQPSDNIKELAKEIYHEQPLDIYLSPKWLNDGVSLFLSEKVEPDDDKKEFLILSNFSIYHCSPEYAFAMKLQACRSSKFKDDIEDLKVLISGLEIQDFNQAMNIYEKYYSRELLPTRHEVILKDLLSKNLET